MNEITLEQYISKNLAASVLIGAGAATVIGTGLAGADLGFEGIAQNILPLGAPAAVGILAGNLILTPKSQPGARGDLMRGAIAGGSTVALLMGVGAIPVTLDSQTMVLALTVGAGSMIGDYAGSLLYPPVVR